MTKRVARDLADEFEEMFNKLRPPGRGGAIRAPGPFDLLRRLYDWSDAQSLKRARNDAHIGVYRRRMIVCPDLDIRSVAGGRACADRSCRMLVSVLIVLLCGFIDRRAIAQELVGPSLAHSDGPGCADGRAREGSGSNAGVGFQGMCERLPGHDRHPRRQVHDGLACERARPTNQRRPAARGDDRAAIRCFQVRGDVRGMGCLRRRGWMPASPRRLGTWGDASAQRELGRR